MKRIFVAFLSLFLIAAFVGCQKDQKARDFPKDTSMIDIYKGYWQVYRVGQHSPSRWEWLKKLHRGQ